MTSFTEEAQRAATNRTTAGEQAQEKRRREFLKDYATDFEVAVVAVVGPEFLEEDARLLTDEEIAAVWPTHAGEMILGLGTDGVLFTCDPEGDVSSLYAFVRCLQCGTYRSRWLRGEEPMADVGDLLLASCKHCSERGEGQAPKRIAKGALDFRHPVAAVLGGSDSDNLAAIAHNLGVIANKLDGFFDCGASMAGRGV